MTNSNAVRCAAVQGGKVINVLIADPATDSLPGGATLIASDSANIGDDCAGGVFTAPQEVSDYPAEARSALDASDMTALRCMKAGIAFPADWQAYCATLRAIVAGTQSGPLPARPNYPAGK